MAILFRVAIYMLIVFYDWICFNFSLENDFPKSNLFELDFDDSGFPVAAILPKRNYKIFGADQYLTLDNIKNISLIEKIKLRSAVTLLLLLRRYEWVTKKSRLIPQYSVKWIEGTDDFFFFKDFINFWVFVFFHLDLE